MCVLLFIHEETWADPNGLKFSALLVFHTLKETPCFAFLYAYKENSENLNSVECEVTYVMLLITALTPIQGLQIDFHKMNIYFPSVMSVTVLLYSLPDLNAN